MLQTLLSTTALAGVAAAIIGVPAFVAVTLRRVVPTNRVDIVQSRKHTRSYGKSRDEEAFALMREVGAQLPLVISDGVRTLSLLGKKYFSPYAALARERDRVTGYMASLKKTDCSHRQMIWRLLELHAQEVLLSRIEEAMAEEQSYAE